jgi:hypothetical protein
MIKKFLTYGIPIFRDCTGQTFVFVLPPLTLQVRNFLNKISFYEKAKINNGI